MSTTPEPHAPAQRSTVAPPTGQPPESFQGRADALVDRVVNLLDPTGNILLGTTQEQACAAVRRGDLEAVRHIGGQFAICQQIGEDDSHGSIDWTADAVFPGQTRRGTGLDRRRADRRNLLNSSRREGLGRSIPSVVHANGSCTPPAGTATGRLSRSQPHAISFLRPTPQSAAGRHRIDWCGIHRSPGRGLRSLAGIDPRRRRRSA